MSNASVQAGFNAQALQSFLDNKPDAAQEDAAMQKIGAEQKITDKLMSSTSIPPNSQLFVASESESRVFDEASVDDLRTPGETVFMLGKGEDGERTVFKGTITANNDGTTSVDLKSPDSPNTVNSVTFGADGSIQSVSNTQSGKASDLLTNDEFNRAKLNGVEPDDIVTVTRTVSEDPSGLTVGSVAVNEGDEALHAARQDGEFTAEDAYNHGTANIAISNIATNSSLDNDGLTVLTGSEGPPEYSRMPAITDLESSDNAIVHSRDENGGSSSLTYSGQPVVEKERPVIGTAENEAI